MSIWDDAVCSRYSQILKVRSDDLQLEDPPLRLRTAIETWRIDEDNDVPCSSLACLIASASRRRLSFSRSISANRSAISAFSAS